MYSVKSMILHMFYMCGELTTKNNCPYKWNICRAYAVLTLVQKHALGVKNTCD